jgi:hypothetical protein
MIYKKHCIFRNVAKWGHYFVISVKKWVGGFSFCCFDVTHDGDIPWGCTIFFVPDQGLVFIPLTKNDDLGLPT